MPRKSGTRKGRKTASKCVGRTKGPKAGPLGKAENLRALRDAARDMIEEGFARPSDPILELLFQRESPLEKRVEEKGSSLRAVRPAKAVVPKWYEDKMKREKAREKQRLRRAKGRKK